MEMTQVTTRRDARHLDGTAASVVVPTTPRHQQLAA
jgi:hypothetical protein